jgi:hypothetical protein
MGWVCNIPKRRQEQKARKLNQQSRNLARNQQHPFVRAFYHHQERGFARRLDF